MNHTERTGVDIKTAFASYAKQRPLRTEASPNTPDTRPSSGESRVLGLRARLKMQLRRVAKACYRLVRPVWGPIAFRSRAYLAAPALAEFARLHQQLHLEYEQSQRDLNRIERSFTHQNAGLQRELRRIQNRIDGALIADRPTSRTATQPVLDRVSGPSDEVTMHSGRASISCAAEDLQLILNALQLEEYGAAANAVLSRLLPPAGTMVVFDARDVGHAPEPLGAGSLTSRLREAGSRSAFDVARHARVDLLWIQVGEEFARPIALFEEVAPLFANRPDMACVWSLRRDVLVIAPPEDWVKSVCESGYMAAHLDLQTGSVTSIGTTVTSRTGGDAIVLAPSSSTVWQRLGDVL